MGRRSLRIILAFAFVACMVPLRAQPAPAILDLSGSWKFQADSKDAGVSEKWFSKVLRDNIHLPGSMAQSGKGDDPGVATKWTGGIIDRSWFIAPEYAKYRAPGNVKVPFWLTPDKYYVGPAWYQREITIPESWQGQRVVLFLERCHWETRLWVDGKEAGMQNSLGTPHEYDLSRLLMPGPHRLTLRVDNRLENIDVGSNAHSVSDHTQTNWNGIVGRLELRVSPAAPAIIRDLRIFPDITAKKIKLLIDVGNSSGKTLRRTFVLSARSFNGGPPHDAPLQSAAFQIPPGESTVEVDYVMGDKVRLWDEFAANLYRLSVVLEDRGSMEDQKSVQFGMRDFRTAGTRFAVNGRPVFLRGTLECCIFPLTGYPPTDLDAWLRIFAVCRAHGLNHMRFHSWCPPEAAFDAADRSGFYLYVECGAWTNVGDGRPFDQWLYEESERIVKAYGNHPSFCMMSYGNEPGGKNQARFLGDFVAYWKKKDPRRLYTSAAGWPQVPENDWHSTPDPRIQAWGGGLNSIINKEPPKTNYDWASIIAKADKPVVSHEIGQWCVYPNFQEIPKYTGVLKARNFEIFKDTLEVKGLGELAEDFLRASGKLQALCYKADIEAALRTPGFAGFELLDLHDFPGQGTALVGVLDAFWGEKGYIAPLEFRRFCGPTVPLARLAKMIYLNTEHFAADIEAAHFGPAPLTNVRPTWTVLDQDGRILWWGSLTARDIPWGNVIKLGRIDLPLERILTARKCVLQVKIGQAENAWDFWVYPAKLPDPASRDVLIARRLDAAAVDHLDKGGKVLLSVEKGAVRPDKGGRVAVGFSSIFWNTAWTGKQAPHTLGIFCDPKHPALADFPTEFHSHWQWWDAMSRSQAVVLDEFGPDLRPIVRIIDDWFTNRSLGLVFEAKVGRGKLLVTGIDLLSDADKRPEARQLLYSLKKYMSGPAFQPVSEMDLDRVKGLFLY